MTRPLTRLEGDLPKMILFQKIYSKKKSKKIMDIEEVLSAYVISAAFERTSGFQGATREVKIKQYGRLQ